MEKTLEITEECTTLTISIETAELVEEEDLWVERFPGDPASREVEMMPYFIVDEWSEDEVTERILLELMREDKFKNMIKRLYRAIPITEIDYTESEIINIVCNAYHVTVGKVRSKTLLRHITEARQIVCYLLRKLKDITDEDIGMIVNRARSTVSVSVGVIEGRIETNQLLVKNNVKLNMLLDKVKDLEDRNN